MFLACADGGSHPHQFYSGLRDELCKSKLGAHTTAIKKHIYSFGFGQLCQQSNNPRSIMIM